MLFPQLLAGVNATDSYLMRLRREWLQSDELKIG